MSDPGVMRGFIGLAFTFVGILWMAAAGLCSGGFLVLLFTDAASAGEILSILPMVLIVGGFGIGIGFAIYVVGRALKPK